MNNVDFSVLVGNTIESITGKKGDNEILFKMSNGSIYKMYHEQDCCESVYVEDIIGDWESIIGTPVLKAEESTNSDNPINVEWDESFTWTFYHIVTFNGSVTIRWYGTSNGYYSESVDFEEMKGELIER